MDLSDYYICFQWDGLTFQCRCPNDYYNAYIDLGRGWIYQGAFPGPSYYGYDCKYGIGPSKSGYAKTQNNKGGDHCRLLFECTYGCTANWHSTDFNKYFQTALIRPPTAPTATQGKWNYRIDLTWKNTTDIPDAEHGYRILRDGIEIAQVYNGQRTYSVQTLGPTETHSYTIQTIWPDNASNTNISSGVSDRSDNCICTANPLQEDFNASGIGDASEIVIPGISRPAPAEGFNYSQNYPNPFNEKTTLTYVQPFESHIIMKVFDIVGNEVEIIIDENVMQGTWEVTWDSKGFGDGIYFCTIYAKSNVTNDVAVKTIKMLKAR